MSEKRITWTAKTRRGMKRIVDAGVIAMSLEVEPSKLTKAQKEEVENAKLWLAQETEGDE